MNDEITFSAALACLKEGEKVARKGWNGQGMWIALSPGFTLGMDRVYSGAVADHIGPDRDGVFRAYLMMKTVDDEFVPWVASQTDLLAEDWKVVH